MCGCVCVCSCRGIFVQHLTQCPQYNAPRGTHTSITSAHTYLPNLRKRCPHINMLMYSDTNEHRVLQTEGTQSHSRDLYPVVQSDLPVGTCSHCAVESSTCSERRGLQMNHTAAAVFPLFSSFLLSSFTFSSS